MKSLRIFIFIILTGSLNALGGGVTYYVATTGNNNNPGTLSSPWKTISKAANTLVAGDTVQIRGGTYKEQVTPKNSGNISNGFITYSAYPGETVTLDASGGLNWNWNGVFDLSNRSYIQISGLRIINSPGFGLFMSNSTHMQILKNYTYNTAYSGIYAENSDTITIDGNEVELANVAFSQESLSIVASNNFVVSNNRVHGGKMEGIDAKVAPTNGKIFGNLVYDMLRLGIYVDAWDGTANNIEIYGNTVFNSQAIASGAGEDGIRIGGEQGGTASNIKIYNNILYNLAGSGINLAKYTEPGFQEPTFSAISIYNNTTYNCGTRNSNYSGGIDIQGSSAFDITVRNNILSQNRYFPIRLSTSLPTANVTLSNNLIDKSTYSQAFNSVNGANAIIGSPLFVNAAGKDFRLQSNSPARDAGYITKAPTQDFDGKYRISDYLIDIGAYEYENLISNAGFENGNISPWNNWGTNFTAVYDQSYLGSWAGKIGENSGGGINIKVNANTSYKLSAYGRVTGQEWGAIGYAIYDSNGNKIVSDTYASRFSFSYSQKSLSFLTPANAASVQILVWNSSGGTLYIDQISFGQ